MIHENFLVRDDFPTSHIYEGHRETMSFYWASVFPICGASVKIGETRTAAGDGRPICRRCAVIAKKRGWV